MPRATLVPRIGESNFGLYAYVYMYTSFSFPLASQESSGVTGSYALSSADSRNIIQYAPSFTLT